MQVEDLQFSMQLYVCVSLPFCAWCVWFGMHLFYYFDVIFQYFRHVCAINLWMVFIWCDVGVYWFCYGFCLLLMYVCGCMSIGFILVLHMFCFNLYIAWFHCWASIWDFHFFWFCFVFMHCWFDLACFFKYSFDLIF